MSVFWTYAPYLSIVVCRKIFYSWVTGKLAREVNHMRRAIKALVKIGVFFILMVMGIFVLFYVYVILHRRHQLNNTKGK